MIQRNRSDRRAKACARTICMAVLVAAFAKPALAQRAVPGTGGSLPLIEVMAVATRYPNLLSEIRLQLLAAGLKRDAVTCAADRFSSDWAHMGGARVAPYDCSIGSRTLRITAVPTYFDRNGHRVKADDTDIRAKAVSMAQSGLKWQWK